ncbi:hypothetical protein HCX49_05840 [Sphingobacterium kitahiroshimense]|uniref:Mov34/MPN/PAD-1 family protein n=1 Tax=Sphingobacterium sp. B16(2022) TaxID=2914044 RepID=UPI00143BF64F|nr:Mov34/MPN/PAD-1 family protein [Sphingobacterium sp. B16(2022)]NJI72720.1 hypothetical protein [Sphingobacterium sp. B16(2022)]
MNKLYCSDDNLFTVNITDDCINYIKELSFNSQNETGGILIGNYQNDYSVAYISLITGPPKDSKKARFTFTRGVSGLSKILDENWGVGKYYLGEWHFHPGTSPEPSRQDVNQIHQISQTGKYECPEPILLIIGGTK